MQREQKKNKEKTKKDAVMGLTKIGNFPLVVGFDRKVMHLTFECERDMILK